MTEVFNNTVTQTMHETATATMTDVVNNVSAFIVDETGTGIAVTCACGACMVSGYCAAGLSLARCSANGKFPALFRDGPAWTCSCQTSSDLHDVVVADLGLLLCLDHFGDRDQDHARDGHRHHDRYHQQHGHGYRYRHREAHRFVNLTSCSLDDTDHMRNSYHDGLRDCGMLFPTLFHL